MAFNSELNKLFEGDSKLDRTYYLVNNMMYAHTFIMQKRWWHWLIGAPPLTITKCVAKSRSSAQLKFEIMGHKVGLLTF